jgi:MATE family multidrug resistance protein
MGALGAAWGTFGARLILMAMLVAWIVRMRDAPAMGVFARPAADPAGAAEQRRIGYGAGVAFFAETAAFNCMNIVAGWVGGCAVAGWAIVLNVSAIIFMVPLGLGAAASVLVARAHGADDRAGVARAGLAAFGVTAAFTAMVTVFVWSASPFIAGLYSVDPPLVAAVAGALTLACLFLVADGLQVVGAQALRARGDVLFPTVAQVVSYAVVMLPLGWALAIPMGLALDGIVLAVTVASFISAGLLLGRFWALARR